MSEVQATPQDMPVFKTKLKTYKKSSQQNKKYYETFKAKNSLNKFHCEACKEDISYFAKSNHLKTAKHQKNQYIYDSLH